MASSFLMFYAPVAIVYFCCIASVSAFEAFSVPGKCHSNCPDLDFNKSCNTGNCASGGLVSYWEIPLDAPSKELGYKNPKVKYTKGLLSKKVSKGHKLKKYTSVTAIEAHDASDCCLECKLYSPCKYWQFVNVGCGCGAGLCLLYGPTKKPKCVGKNGGVPPSAVGAKCQKPNCNDDPHLTGAHGTSYDFNGIPNRSFCLVTDKRIHINMKMTGYYDERSDSASVMVNGKALRTWIRELGVIWSVGNEEHRLRFVAREGNRTMREEGFLAAAELDGETIPRMTSGSHLELPGGLTLDLSFEKKGSYEVDAYSVKIDGLLDMDMKLRVANPLLWAKTEVFSHISVGFNELVHSPSIHGVLGQTYRKDHEQRAFDFGLISSELHRPIAADGESGKGFLDGKSTDYISTHVLSPDCVFSEFESIESPSVSSE